MGPGGASASFSPQWTCPFLTLREFRHSFRSLLLASTTKVSVCALERSARSSDGGSTEAGCPLEVLTTPFVKREILLLSKLLSLLAR